MKKTSPAVDAHIANAAEFARPILEKLRSLFHKACPEIEETLKWGCPHFEYKGIVAGMAGFKQHVRFHFSKGALLKGPDGQFQVKGNTTLMHAEIKTLADLPADKVLLALIREAVALNEQGVKLPRSKKVPKGDVKVPEDLLAALKKNPKALATFEEFSVSNKREYVDWLTEARQAATRQKRLETAIEWMAEGKTRNWKYQRK